MFVSPLDMFVTVPSGRSNGFLPKGAIILLLDMTDLQRQVDRMDMLRDMVRVMARKVDIEYVERYVAKPLREQRDLLQSGADRLAAVALEVRDRQKVGEVTSTDLANAKRDLAAARAATFESDDALRQKLADVERQRNLKTIAEQRILGELEYYKAQIEKRTILAPSDGILKLHVASTMFVEKGDVLASFIAA